MKKKLKLKKKVRNILIIIIFLIFLSIFGINKYKEYKYKQTNEYKLTQVGYTLEESKFIIDKLFLISCAINFALSATIFAVFNVSSELIENSF